MTAWRTETARTVYERTYSRELPSGELETWPQTVERVVDGNLALVDEQFIEPDERERLVELIETFKVLPAGRHLRGSGVTDYALNNCWAAGWDPARPEEHFTFTLLRLAEGGGVGANYSNRYFAEFPAVENALQVHIVCDPAHPDYTEMAEAGLLSGDYAYTWHVAYAVEDSREGWAAALADLIRTAHNPQVRHTDRVYDVSRLRRKGAALRSFGGTASGPAPFAELLIRTGEILADCAGFPLTGMDAMEIDHEIARCIVAGGVRRSARMSVMHWRDSQIEEFVRCKREQSEHWTTNISVEVDSEFITMAEAGDPAARKVLTTIAEGALRDGEPGFWNSSLSAVGEPDGTYTVNPCGEATLNQWEPCNLGSLNLAAFVEDGRPDWEELDEAHRLLTRYLVRATFAPVADRRSAEVIARNRRIGVGHTGLADYLAKQGIPYSQAAHHDHGLVAYDLQTYAAVVDRAAQEYAAQLRIPVPVKRRVVAPTGTISKLAGVSGEGIHAPYAGYFVRRIRFSLLDPAEAAQVEEYRRSGYHVEPCIYAANTAVVAIPTRDVLLDEVLEQAYEHAGQLDLDAMLSVQEMYQQCWADQAVSYTAVIDPDQYTVEDLAGVLLHYMPRLKGSTVFPESSRAQAPYERITAEEYERLTADLDHRAVDTSYDEDCTSGACPI
ncbi:MULTISPECIES: ribonucleoside-triphosphate reductase, adenosylcobalamin-dependent [Streptomycetaceae]|uniref:Adenosylcobalamin-dependent ribonucleoside-triphosphate reductase n=1 Tax=Streptantibioticus cattleyicolor (strain ATCC 35852 / DSM 46488 / JCM 4925 / NBRC 14057 / NRRL 8057) TaxID=1003195 RepID=F8JPW5_STREN|nr:ribonucleoside-triphosphate reductase, adenosylcobalamin-dependent [Streptantibioticus cattleyicolor]AEW94018.1 gp50 [Streptantibioticus cattleyicolor NRRL 8057 = DSM 46488]MYS58690.1 ribonucleoside-triphosphate reductase, adenosylcobalamin-dependent [Streptomyces sp. SID5468]CCB74367.1 putative adenosylcobalamin-dependent ribonucleoside-triphosphate reductase [Streptantibioticus cattleyicolor NRRL 8057 = DSM 46488]